MHTSAKNTDPDLDQGPLSHAVSAEDRHLADALYNQGILAKRNGNTHEALACYRKALQYNPDDVDAWYNLGEALASQGHFTDARDAFIKTVALQPNDAKAWNNLGFVMQKLGQTAEAHHCYQQAVCMAPTYELAHKNLSAIHLAEGNVSSACTCLEKALELLPMSSELHYEMGNAYGMAGDDERALVHYTRSVQLDAGNGEAHHGAGLAYLRTLRPAETVASLRRAIRCDPDRKSYWQIWANALKRSPTTVYPQLEADLVTCLTMDGIDKGYLSSIIPRFIFQHHRTGALMNRINAEPVASFDEMLTSGELLDGLDCPLINRFLENVIATDPQWELAWVRLRSRLLKLTLEGKIPGSVQMGHLPLMCALARQCFLNEYVYHAPADEYVDAQRMAEAVTSELNRSHDSIPAFKIALLATYFPLFKTPLRAFADRFADGSVPLAELAELQIRQPLHEQSLSAKIPCLAPIEDAVSLDVRSQYEENPYPRWTDAGYQRAMTLQSRLNGIFSHWRADLPDAPRILVAGCGTGRHAINCARGYRDASVTAMDLSLASLAYGKRKALESGLVNIEFVQGDLLTLKAIGNPYDLIECVGVLHHLEDPLEGWRRLIDHLKPGGLMKIGLYSRIAREYVEEVRRFIARNGYQPSAEGIRAFRFDMLNSGQDPLHRLTRQSTDFYAMSACRDLFFHVKEHCFSLPQIKRILESLRLEFIGFELDSPGALSKYRKQYPGDKTGTDLDNWNRFEQMHPTLFYGMYQFWVRSQ